MASNITLLQNLDRLQKIVDDKGIPTQFFIRWLQNRGGALTDLDAVITLLQQDITSLEDELVIIQSDITDLEDIELVAGDYLVGGGFLGSGGPITFDHDTSGASPGTYGSATNSAQITVDEFGHITGVTDVPISGGGGGGGGAWPSPDWTELTLAGSSGTHYAYTSYLATETFALSAGQRLVVEAYVYKSTSATRQCGILAGDNAANNAYMVRSAPDGNQTTRRIVGGSESVMSSNGASTNKDIATGFEFHSLTIACIGTSANRVRGGYEGQEVANVWDNTTHFDLNGKTMAIALVTDDITKCVARARVISL